VTIMEAPGTRPLDLSPLLAPIAGDRPAGQWLRYDAVYDEIRKARQEDDAALSQGVWKRELKRADWNAVAEKASQALATRSKDLQLAVWLTEAWLHIYGYAGLAGGMRLIAALCREFWDGLYPPLDGDSAEARLAPMAWAADKLLLPLKSVAVTSPAGEESVPLTWADRELALYYENMEQNHPAEAASAYQQGTISHPQFLISASLTSGEWFASLARDVAAARQALAETGETLATCAGEANTPSLAPLAAPLEAIAAFAARVLAERVHSGEIESPPAEAGAAAPQFVPLAHDVPLTPGTPVASRGEAFQRLREAAEFLFRTEPHSPVPYLIMRAVSWEHLPLPELLAELLQKNDLAAVYALLGLQQES